MELREIVRGECRQRTSMGARASRAGPGPAETGVPASLPLPHVEEVKRSSMPRLPLRGRRSTHADGVGVLAKAHMREVPGAPVRLSPLRRVEAGAPVLLAPGPLVGREGARWRTCGDATHKGGSGQDHNQPAHQTRPGTVSGVRRRDPAPAPRGKGSTRFDRNRRRARLRVWIGVCTMT